MKKCEEGLGPVREKLETAENKRSEIRKAGEDAVKEIQDKEKKLEKIKSNVERLDASIQEYISQGKENQLKERKREKDEIETKLTTAKDVRVTVENKISKLRVEVSNQESRRRNFDDNLKLREYHEEEKKHSKDVMMQKTALEERDWAKVEKKKNDLHRKWTEMNA